MFCPTARTLFNASMPPEPIQLVKFTVETKLSLVLGQAIILKMNMISKFCFLASITVIVNIVFNKTSITILFVISN